MRGWAGHSIRRLEIVDSTNLEARRWARADAPHGAVVIAGAQTAGRGRRGRDWISMPGQGLWLSIVLRPDIDKSRYPLLPFVAALAAADACHAVTGADIFIKWPNDLLLAGKKITGILVEAEADAAIMGIGINVCQRTQDFPPDLREKAGSLQGLTGMPVSPGALERPLLDGIEHYLAAFADILSLYAARCATLGQAVRVKTVNGTFCGVAEGLDSLGALRVRDASGALHQVLAGDVSIRGANGYA